MPTKLNNFDLWNWICSFKNVCHKQHLMHVDDPHYAHRNASLPLIFTVFLQINLNQTQKTLTQGSWLTPGCHIFSSRLFLLYFSLLPYFIFPGDWGLLIAYFSMSVSKETGTEKREMFHLLLSPLFSQYVWCYCANWTPPQWEKHRKQHLWWMLWQSHISLTLMTRSRVWAYVCLCVKSLAGDSAESSTCRKKTTTVVMSEQISVESFRRTLCLQGQRAFMTCTVGLHFK